MRSRPLAALVPLLMGACFGGLDPNLTDDGLSKPEVTISFPATVDAGSTATAEITVVNPGPGEFESLVIAFARLGDPDLPPPIVDVGPPGSSAVVGVDPPPIAVSEDGVVYRFEGLEEDESTTISFELEVPSSGGRVANAVLVYEGQRTDRARGGRLETTVETGR